MSPRATLIRGDGIGPEIMDATLAVLEAGGARMDWDEQLAGVAAVEEAGTPLPDSTVESIRHTGVALNGPLTTLVGTGFRSVNVALRREFDAVRQRAPGQVHSPGRPHQNVDIVLVRRTPRGSTWDSRPPSPFRASPRR